MTYMICRYCNAWTPWPGPVCERCETRIHA